MEGFRHLPRFSECEAPVEGARGGQWLQATQAFEVRGVGHGMTGWEEAEKGSGSGLWVAFS